MSTKQFLLGMLAMAVMVVIVIGVIVYNLGFMRPADMVRTVEPTPAASDEDLIKQALYTKNNWSITEAFTLEVKTNDGKYASGSINGQGGGGFWFAQKTDGEWKIVADGNGIIACKDLEPYPDFPTELIPKCHNVVTGELIDR